MKFFLDSSLNITTLECALRSTRNDWLNNAKLIFQLRHQKESIDINKIVKIIKCSLQVFLIFKAFYFLSLGFAGSYVLAIRFISML